LENLKQYFQGVGFSEEDLEIIMNSFFLKEFKKDEYFIEVDKISKHLGFIATGTFQYFVLLNDGEERTTYMAIENSFVASLLSFLNETPSREYIRALSDSSVWLIEKSSLLNLQNTIPAFKDFYIELLEWQISCIDKSRLDFIMLTAEQRYEKMLKEEPHLLHKIPLQYLASILGVTPRHLSRIRKNIA